MTNEKAETITVASKLERAPTRNVGSRLRNGREQKNLSVEEVARKLFLNTRLVQQIEEDDYKNLPAVTFMRGYLRAYANLVDLDAEAVIRDFNALGLVDAPAPMSTQRIYHRETSLFGRSLPWVGLILGIFLVLLVVVWIHSEYANTALNDISANGGVAAAGISQTANANSATASTTQENVSSITMDDATAATTSPALASNTDAAAGSAAADDQAPVTASAADSSDTENTVAVNDQTATDAQSRTAGKKGKSSKTEAAAALAQNTGQSKPKNHKMASPF